MIDLKNLNEVKINLAQRGFDLPVDTILTLQGKIKEHKKELEYIYQLTNKNLQNIQDKLRAKELSKAVEEKLSPILAIIPNLEELINSNILWALFTNHESMSVSHTWIEKAQNALEEHDIVGKFFPTSVENVFKGKSFSISIDEENVGIKVDVSTLVLDMPLDVHVYPTLPDSEIVFANFLEVDENWIYELMDMYEEWREDVMRDTNKYLWQIGGHGKWIQGSYNNHYIAQANLGLGDGGSVFIYEKAGHLYGRVDMY